MSTMTSATLLGTIADSPRHHSTVLLVQWALALACTYMVLFSEQSGGLAGLGSVVILAFLVMNLLIGRMNVAVTQSRGFMATVGFIDAVLIVASLEAAGQLSVELVLLCLGIVILAVSGLRLATIAIASLGMIGAYLLIVILTGDESPWRSGTLLRLPFLFIAAVVYAWYVELGSMTTPTSSGAQGDLVSQLQAIERCRLALGNGATGAAENALAEIEERAQALQRSLARA